MCVDTGFSVTIVGKVNVFMRLAVLGMYRNIGPKLNFAGACCAEKLYVLITFTKMLCFVLLCYLWLSVNVVSLLILMLKYFCLYNVQ